jgi:uncharacterized protein YbjT (DUF2867 family)
MKLVTVFSASGRPGLAQVRQLLLAGYKVRAVTRESKRLENFDGIEIVSADYNDPDSVYDACQGSDTVFFTAPSFEESHKGMDFCATVGTSAKKAGVRRIIFNTCCWGNDEEEVGQAAYDASRLMINTLMQAGVPTTTFRPVIFMDNLLTDWARRDILENNIYTYPHYPDLEANWICLDDVAKFMIAAIDRDDLIGRRIVIGGEEAFVPQRVADMLSGRFGKKIEYKQLPLKDFAKRLFDIFYSNTEGANENDFIESMSDFYRFTNETHYKPFKVDMAPVLKEIPIKLKPFSEWMNEIDWDETIDTNAG